MVKGHRIQLSIEKAFAEECDENMLFVDYPNIVKIVKTGSRIFIDDGLISLVVLDVG